MEEEVQESEEGGKVEEEVQESEEGGKDKRMRREGR